MKIVCELMLSRIGRAYARSMDKRPWSTQMATCAGLFGAGDWCAQMLEFALNVTSPGKTTYNYKRTGRMITYGFFLGGPIYYGWYGVLLGEPPFPLMGSMLVLVGLVHEQPRPCHVWPRSYDSSLVLPRPCSPANATKSLSGMRGMATKITADSLLFNPPLLVVYFGATGVLEGKTVAQIKEKVENSWLDAYVACCMFWPFVQILNFRFIPVAMQAIPSRSRVASFSHFADPRQANVVNTVGIGWQSYL